jgi:hypothetical protein
MNNRLSYHALSSAIQSIKARTDGVYGLPTAFKSISNIAQYLHYLNGFSAKLTFLAQSEQFQ